MNYEQLSKKARRFYPALALNDILSRKNRKRLRTAFSVLFLICIFFFSVSDVFIGISLILLSILLLLWPIEMFFNYFYYSAFQRGGKYISFELAEVLFKTNRSDLTKGFFRCSLGRHALLRCGIIKRDFKEFLKGRVGKVISSDLNFPEEVRNVSGYAGGVLGLDSELENFLFKRGVLKNDFLVLLRWLESENNKDKREDRWWSKEKLGRVPKIGRSWTYGRPYELLNFSINILDHISGDKFLDKSQESHIDSLETILSRSEEADAVLIGEEGSGRNEIISVLAEKSKEGKTTPDLNFKDFLVLDHNYLLSQNKDKSSFESEIIKIMDQSVSAGNVVIILEDLPSFILNARSIGVNLPDILDPYFSSKDFKIIALSDRDSFHKILETDPHLSSKFEKIMVETPGDVSSLVGLLLSKIPLLESSHGVFFTYQAIKEIAGGVERYFAGSESREKSFDILDEIVPFIRSRKSRIITKAVAEEFLQNKTGISIGTIKTEEKTKLENLESILHDRVIGQDEAIKSISSAVRRSRSGVSNSKRPIGSFLFFGPTGVGKTETAKTLARVFFGSEDNMIRLDMSEFNLPESLNKLIGSYETGESGILSSKVKDNPYTVLLLDEFEKAHQRVLDLFLQILDEGMFSDMHGKKISLRSIIIIATSNAGSDLIWDLIRRGENLTDQKDYLIEEIIKRGIFKPELLNRFDATVVFHPLLDAHLEKIAGIMLTDLRKRMKAKGILLQTSDDLVGYLVQKGKDIKFGARPLRRIIQEEIEEVIAKKIIAGGGGGEKVVISSADLSS